MAFTSYEKLLKSIQDTTIMLADHVELDQPIIEIDWDTRTMKLPSEYQSFIGVQNDHQADTVYFCADRYFDTVDLSTLTCVVEYVNANKEGRISPILDIDTTTDPNKIYFGWKLGAGATKASGSIKFVVRFYTISDKDAVFAYNLSTVPCVANILSGLPTDTLGKEDDVLPMDQAKELLALVRELEEKAVSWTELVLEY